MSGSLKIEGAVGRPSEFSFAEIETLAGDDVVCDMTRFGMRHPSDAIKLSRLLAAVVPDANAGSLVLRSSQDNYQASVPLEPVRETALVIFRADGKPLDSKLGGPFRFFIPDFVPCNTGELDACSNVKFIDSIEVCRSKAVKS